MLVDYFHVKLRQSIAALLPLNTTVEVTSVSKRDICLIPGANPALLGVINHHGRLLWVLDLSDFLGIPELQTEKPAETLTLVVLKPKAHAHLSAAIERQVACVVSGLQEIVSLHPHEFESTLIPELSGGKSFLTETVLVKNLPMAILDVESVFARLQISDSALSSVF